MASSIISYFGRTSPQSLVTSDLYTARNAAAAGAHAGARFPETGVSNTHPRVARPQRTAARSTPSHCHLHIIVNAAHLPESPQRVPRQRQRPRQRRQPARNHTTGASAHTTLWDTTTRCVPVPSHDTFTHGLTARDAHEPPSSTRWRRCPRVLACSWKDRKSRGRVRS
jgi:hypothetical protein